VKIYVINLKRRPDRLAQMIQDYGLTFHRIDAVDGNDPELGLASENFCTPTESACWISHQKAWESMISEQVDFALILEDDSVIDPSFVISEVLSRSATFMKTNNIDLLQLGFFQDIGRKKSLLIKIGLLKRQELSQDFLSKVYPDQHGIGTHAYVISRSDAEKLIRINRPVFLAADAALMYIAQGQKRSQRIRIWQIQNSIFSQRPLTPTNFSDVQSL
jgi:GR25 family glycosyltransferase involved in LPS biosynthesis